MAMGLLVAGLVGYLFGSIPFGLVLTRLAGHGDVRNIGSGNIGATNVLRTGNKGLAALTLLLDMLKGFVPVVLISQFYDFLPYGLLAGFMALIGHMFPMWLKFKGGKGVATYIGVAFGFSYLIGLTFIAIWLAMAFSLRYSSLSALTAALITPMAAFFLTNDVIAIVLFLMSLLVIIAHRANIERLIKGEEDKIGQKSSS